MSRKIQFALLFLLLASLSIATQSVFAQSDGPLNFGNNFFVTGDYVVAGAYGLHTNVANGYSSGLIAVPDLNPGIQPGATNTCVISGITFKNCVPAGAQIVAAYLYWQTIESSTTTPGSIGSGQNGFFRPLFPGGPQTGYAISGVNVASKSTVSPGGCTDDREGPGTIVRTYRADVRGLLPEDAKGNVLPNSRYEVRLRNNDEGMPHTRGATLVIIYRVLSPNVPLNSIVIYDGDFNVGNAFPSMTQVVRGFYQAASNPVSRLTHIVGGGHHEDNYQSVSLNGMSLHSLYPFGQPPFPGWYGGWDNPTWTFVADPKSNPLYGGKDSATTQVARTSREGCVSWGGIILSTTVQSSDGDGLLDVWKANQGYTDVKTGQRVDLTGAKPNQRDVFIQLDHVVDPNGDFTPDPLAVSKVQSAFLTKNIHLHITAGNAIQEQTCQDNLSVSPPQLCPYPNQPGITTFRAGFEFVKNQPINYPDESSCETAASGPCVRRFPPAQKDSYRYVVFGDALGAPNWTLGDGTLKSVVASGTAVTFTTSTPHLLSGMGDPHCTLGRVTVVDAITNPGLNGTYCVQSSTDTTFTITIGSNSKTPSYSRLTDPNLAVAAGQAGSRSGTSDLGGAGALITLGNWGANGQNPLVQAGTLMHELGHTFGLTHGGSYYDTAGSPYLPTLEPNCKPNYQSVMSYLFQVDLLDKNVLDKNGNNILVGGIPDYSEDTLITLTEVNLSKVSALTLLNSSAPPTYFTTKWYAPKILNQPGTAAKRYCDGTPLPASNPPAMYRQEGPVNLSGFPLLWADKQDIDFDPNGSPSAMLRGFNDWANLDLRQIGATGSSYAIGGGFPIGGGGFPIGGGGFPIGGGGFPIGGGGFPIGGGGFPIGGGTSAGDITFETANSVTRPPRNLTATEGASARTITLNWTAPTFGQITKYKIYRSSDNGATFNFLTSITGAPPATTYTDTVTCNPTGYRYQVTAVVLTNQEQEQESVPSNTAPLTTPPLLTGCYTNTPPSVALTGFSSPAANATFTQGDLVNVTWSLLDDNDSAVVQNTAANTLLAIGPISPVGGVCPALSSVPVFLTNTGIYPYPVLSVSGITFINNQFTASLNTLPLSAGCYVFELDLDSKTQYERTQFQLLIDVTDTNKTPHITTTALPDGVVGLAYSDTITQDGGTPGFTWTFSPPLPPGISLGLNSGVLSGTPTAVGPYTFMVKVTDSKSNYGTQTLTLNILKANTTTGVTTSVNPSVFGQMVTFTVVVAPPPQDIFTPTGTVTISDGGVAIASSPLTGGTALFATNALPAAIHAITVSYPGDANFNGSSSPTLSQTVQPASTTTSLTSSANPTMFAQPVTFSATVAPVAPGAGMPIGSVTFSDGGTPIASASNLPLSGGTVAFTTSTLSVGFHAITATYAGNTNFVGSASSSISQQINAVVTNTTDGDPGSLRQAILDVNAQSSSQPVGIVFNIPASGVQTIKPLSVLPTLTQPAILDGTTQPGYGVTPIIDLDGGSAGASVSGIHITGGNSTVRGLAVHSFSGGGILIDTNGGDVIQGNYIGTDVAGAAAQPNSGNGIQIIATTNNVVGGTASSMRNLISGNGGEGVRIDGTLATGNIVQGNYIGTDASGSTIVGNTLSGIYIRRAPGNSVIGNVVSGNSGFAGIAICGASSCGGGDPTGIDETSNASGNLVQGNFVGTNSAGTALGNNGAGVSVDGAPNTLVGGTASAMYNVISFNGVNDVQIFDTGATGNKIQGNTIQGKTDANTVGISVGASLTGNTLSQNSISGHGGLGIVGPNNYPVIASALFDSGSGTTTITGNLNSTASTTFTIEFFSSTSCNASGSGEGTIFLGSIPVTTDATGNTPTFTFSVAGPGVGSSITATATDTSGTTTAFSACKAVTSP
jgi:parallel beta-helix repeat protein